MELRSTKSCSDHISLPGRSQSLKSQLCTLQLFVMVNDIMVMPLCQWYKNLKDLTAHKIINPPCKNLFSCLLALAVIRFWFRCFMLKLYSSLYFSKPEPWRMLIQQKRASCESDNALSHTDCTVLLHRPRSPGVGRNCVLRGTCHMLSESGLKQKPVNASRTASQPASQTLPREGEGSRDWGVEVDVCAGVCLCVFLLNEKMVAVATYG